MIWLSPSWRKHPYRKGLSISLGNTTFTIQFWYELAHTDLLIQFRYDFAKQFSQTDLPICDSHRNYEIMRIRYGFAKQFSQTILPICDSHRNDEIMQDLFTSYMTLLTQSCWAVSTYCKNANTWHFPPLFLMYIFNASFMMNSNV